MMSLKELRQLINEVQKRQTESDHVEVKAASGGTPKRLYESLSAFANRTGGGVLLFGLDETKDFAIVGVGDAHRLQEEITHLASAHMEPALRPLFLVDEIEDETVVAVEIEEIPAAQKPCFYKHAGLPKGAYLQVENQQLISSHCSITRRWIWMICPHHGNPNRKSSFIRQKTAAAVSRFPLRTKPYGLPKGG